ncbi:MAG: dihydrophenazinedicarboxylate synthase [Actinomycetota bacterium]|nr:dihydrophenazinedicarboxylate synthase [Actinomycetota bacterium]
MPDSLTGDESIELPEFDAPPANPLDLVREWIERAGQRGVLELHSAVLSTASPTGAVSARTVLVKEVDIAGFVFTTALTSRKARQLAANPSAALTFYWRETMQQITVTGEAHRFAADVDDQLWRDRSREAQATVVASSEGEELESEAALAEAARVLLESPGVIPRPADWGAFRVVPATIEFWHGRANRLHRRLLYTRETGGWVPRRLQP